MATAPLDVQGLRWAGGAMVAAGLAWPLLPGGIVPGCAFRTVTGVPCPLCGMTTSVVATVHLRIDDALAANPAGILAVLVALLLVVRPPSAVRLPRWAPFVGVAALWACQLLRLPFT